MIIIHRAAAAAGAAGRGPRRIVCGLRRGDPAGCAVDRPDRADAGRGPRRRAHLGIEIPTREEMADIEPSEILYRENNARYMTARILCHSETETPQLTDVTLHPHGEGARHGALRRAALLLDVHVARREAAAAAGTSRKPCSTASSRRSSTARRRFWHTVGERIDTMSRNVFETERDGTRRDGGLPRRPAARSAARAT